MIALVINTFSLVVGVGTAFFFLFLDQLLRAAFSEETLGRPTGLPESLHQPLGYLIAFILSGYEHWQATTFLPEVLSVCIQ